MKGDDFHAEYNNVLAMYCKDFDDNRYQAQLETLSEYCKELGIISVCMIAEVLNNLIVEGHLTEVIKLAKFILMIPATNSTSERSCSLLKLIKTCLQSAMKQSRFNQLMILCACKSQVDEIDLTEIASTFVDKSEGGSCSFGGFYFLIFLLCSDLFYNKSSYITIFSHKNELSSLYFSDSSDIIYIAAKDRIMLSNMLNCS